MVESNELLDAVIEVLGTTVIARDELRTALAARDVATGDADQYGLDELDRLVQLTPELGLVGEHGVAHLPSLYAGVAWSVPITADDARHGFITATPLLEPVVEMMLDGDVTLLDADDEELGNVWVDGAEIDGVGVDVVIPPPGFFDRFGGRTATFAVIDTLRVRVDSTDDSADAADTAAPPSDGQLTAVRAAFAEVADTHTITRPLDGVDVEMQTAHLGSLVAQAVAADRSAFVDATVPPLDQLVSAAGLSLDRGLVGAAETDWASMDAWQTMNLVKLNHELTDEQATAYTVLVGAVGAGTSEATGPTADASTPPVPVSVIARALDDPKVAELAWDEWSDQFLIGEGLGEFVTSLSGREEPGVVWLRARQLMLNGETEPAIEALESARASGHAMVLADLAGFAADRSDPLAAKTLLDEAGVVTQVDLDEEYDPITAGTGFGRELAEEIAPFAAMRPRAMAGRNDPCPCGSGRKYKQCHLGNELHAIEHRAGWLYVKMMRFMQLTNPAVSTMIAETIVSDVASSELREMLTQSYLPIDMALHEGRVADRFLDAKRMLLPHDEIALAEQWIDATRSVYEVARSSADAMDVIDLATRDRVTVRETVPEEPLEAGWKVIGRLVPVADSFRAYSGFLPVNDDMVDAMLQGLGTRQLEMVAITIGQIFQTAETHDDMQALFDDNVDDTELRALIEEIAGEMASDEQDAESDDA